MVTIAAGLTTGVFAVGVSKAVGAAFEWKNARVQRIIDGEGAGAGGAASEGARIWLAFAWHCAYSCGLVSFAVALVRCFLPLLPLLRLKLRLRLPPPPPPPPVVSRRRPFRLAPTPQTRALPLHTNGDEPSPKQN